MDPSTNSFGSSSSAFGNFKEKKCDSFSGNTVFYRRKFDTVSMLMWGFSRERELSDEK